MFYIALLLAQLAALAILMKKCNECPVVAETRKKVYNKLVEHGVDRNTAKKLAEELLSGNLERAKKAVSEMERLGVKPEEMARELI
jgi:hypothetical protein